MQTYSEFIKASANKATLTIFDVDETLFNTHASIIVKHDKGETRLSNSEYNTHKLEAGHAYDFKEFASSKIFSKTSTPIPSMVKRITSIVAAARKTALDRTIIVTARSDFDNKKAVVKFFQSHGIDVDNQVYIERAGNLGAGPSAANKRIIFAKYLETGIYKKVVLYDDAISNIHALYSFRKAYPEVTFVGYLVDGHTGKIKKAS